MQVMTVDASPLNNGTSGTLFIKVPPTGHPDIFRQISDIFRHPPTFSDIFRQIQHFPTCREQRIHVRVACGIHHVKYNMMGI